MESTWLHIHAGYNLDSVNRKFIVRVKERMSCTFPHDTGRSGSVETGLKQQIEGDVMYEMIGEGRRLETDEHRTYEYISLQTEKCSMQTLELQENVAYEKHKTTFDHEENVPYQGTDG